MVPKKCQNLRNTRIRPRPAPVVVVVMVVSVVCVLVLASMDGAIRLCQKWKLGRKLRELSGNSTASAGAIRKVPSCCRRNVGEGGKGKAEVPAVPISASISSATHWTLKSACKLEQKGQQHEAIILGTVPRREGTVANSKERHFREHRTPRPPTVSCPLPTVSLGPPY